MTAYVTVTVPVPDVTQPRHPGMSPYRDIPAVAVVVAVAVAVWVVRRMVRR